LPSHAPRVRTGGYGALRFAFAHPELFSAVSAQSAALITETVSRPYRNRRFSRSWRIARSYLASEVFDLIDPEYTLEDMQAAVLLPIELEMASSIEVSRWTPRQWVDAVDEAIRNQHSTLGL